MSSYPTAQLQAGYSIIVSYCISYLQNHLIRNTLQKDSITGTSGVIAWELGRKNIHLIVMWSVPYNLNFYRFGSIFATFLFSYKFVEFYFCYSAYFGFGMVRLSTKFTRDMLPYWYRRMYDGDDAPSTFT